MDWKVGDTFQLESFIPPYRVGNPFDFIIDGIYDTDPVKYPGTDLTAMYFNYKYLYESHWPAPPSVGTYSELIDDPRTPGASARPSTPSLRTATRRPRPRPSRLSAPALSPWREIWRCC